MAVPISGTPVCSHVPPYFKKAGINSPVSISPHSPIGNKLFALGLVNTSKASVLLTDPPVPVMITKAFLIDPITFQEPLDCPRQFLRDPLEG